MIRARSRRADDSSVTRMMGNALPDDKLKDDPIVEAILDVRFEANEIAEIVIGRLSDALSDKESSVKRMAGADIPAEIKQAAPQFKFTPSLEIVRKSGLMLRVGANILAVHQRAPYPGWENFFPELISLAKRLFDALPNLRISRLGLRYINVMIEGRHYVKSYRDLAMAVSVADVRLEAPIHLTFQEQVSSQHVVTTRVVSRPYLAGTVPEGGTVAIDLDVFSAEGFVAGGAEELVQWLDIAHTEEKKAFRRLLPDALFQKLRAN